MAFEELIDFLYEYKKSRPTPWTVLAESISAKIEWRGHSECPNGVLCIEVNGEEYELTVC